MIKTNKNLSVTTINEVTNKPKNSKIEQFLSCFPFGLCNTKPVIAILRLSGVIGRGGSMRSGLSIEGLNDLIERAFNLQKLAAICLVINSPGGSPVQSEMIAKRIIDLSKEKNIQVYSFVEDVAASGGYWLACAGDEIYASRASIIGSIGVISSSFGFHEVIKKLGIERRIYTEGKNKSVLDPFEPAKASDIKIIKSLQKQIHEHFVNYVKSRRKSKLTQSDEILFNGEFWAGASALDLGLIDGIEDMYNFIKNKFGDNVKIKNITSKEPWLKRKLGMISSDDFAKNITDDLFNSVENKAINDKFKIY